MTKVNLITVTAEDTNIRLDRWFKRHYPHISHIALEKALRKGEVRVDKKKVKSGFRLEEGQVIRVPPFKISSEIQEKKPARISGKDEKTILESVIFKNDDIIVINKPAGLAVQGGTGIKVSVDDMLEYLKFGYNEKPKLVHRIDKDTSGILLLARRNSVAAELAEMFKHKKTQKIYWAVLAGVPEEHEGTISSKMLKATSGKGKEKVKSSEDGKTAITHYRLVDVAGKQFSLVELMPVTGRTHQLRVHMAEAGTPILGDGKYGGKKAFVAGTNNKMHLHARKIVLPYKGKDLIFTAELPPHIKATLKFLGLS